jgi:hypothetical protein
MIGHLAKHAIRECAIHGVIASLLASTFVLERIVDAAKEAIYTVLIATAVVASWQYLHRR